MFLCSAVQAIYAIQFVFAAEASSRCVKRALKPWENPAGAFGQGASISHALSNLDHAENGRFESTILKPTTFTNNPDGSFTVTDEAAHVGREVKTKNSVFAGGSSRSYQDSQWATRSTRRQTINPKNLEELIRRGLPPNIAKQLENGVKARVMKNGAPMLPLTSGSHDAPHVTTPGMEQLPPVRVNRPRIEDLSEDPENSAPVLTLTSGSHDAPHVTTPGMEQLPPVRVNRPRIEDPSEDHINTSPHTATPSSHNSEELEDRNPETPKFENSESSTKHEEKEGDGAVGPPVGQEYIVKDGKNGSVTSEVSTPEKKVPSEIEDQDPRVEAMKLVLPHSEYILPHTFQLLAERCMGFTSKSLEAFEKEKGLLFSSTQDIYYSGIIIKQALWWLIEHDSENKFANMIFHYQDINEIVETLKKEFRHMTWEEHLFSINPQVTPTEANSWAFSKENDHELLFSMLKNTHNIS
ncbi:hypothetical protein PCANC_06809 [Puccinia coronata f. sp. avenae]|uniref:Uncharacterized protein n=1 Tax=Puccinia coronata f. sp. avenae TaxID=200324 RepID=A0A2N5UUE6_9BASI|nr:hypothetical protein PCANC_08017 [Puccinia coronata f. sp. avenae]PLW41266.1 hypothetical protein PCANC_06809 [Puccinia coronata f. sp. avenae]